MAAMETQVLGTEIVLDKNAIFNKISTSCQPSTNNHEVDLSLQQSVGPSDFDGRLVRRLGCVESYQAALLSLDYMRGIILACRYELPKELVSHHMQYDLKIAFERAVACVILKHPHMMVGLAQGHTNKPYWTRLREIDLEHHIEWHAVAGGPDNSQAKLLYLISLGLDSRLIDRPAIPGWRIQVLRQQGQSYIEVLLVFSHVNMDANSARLIHRDILRSLHHDSSPSKDAALHGHVLTLPQSLYSDLVPPPEALVEFPVDNEFMAKFLQNEVQTPSAQYARSPMQAHWAPIQATPFKTQYRNITIPSARLAELVQACRLNKVTVTSLLHALVLTSLAPLLDPSTASQLSSMTAMDIRRFLPTSPSSRPWYKPHQAVSNHVTIISHMFDERLVAHVRSQFPPGSSLAGLDSSGEQRVMDLVWEAARSVRQDITNKLHQGVHNDMIGFAQAISDWRIQLAEETCRPRRASWVISNLGVLDSRLNTSTNTASISGPDSESGWAISRAQFIMSANVVSAAIGIATATVRGGDMSISCTWQDCVIDCDIGEAFVTSLEKCLHIVAANATSNKVVTTQN